MMECTAGRKMILGRAGMKGVATLGKQEPHQEIQGPLKWI